jgi:hypothetical protein
MKKGLGLAATIFWAGLALFCLAALLHLRDEAAAKDSLLTLPSVTPTPRRTPQPARPRRTPPPTPLPNFQTPDKIWVVQGEIHQSQDVFVCRAECRSNWGGLTFEVLQTTRGSEDWRWNSGELSKCFDSSQDTEKLFLSGGSWQTPPVNPEESLCFLVVRQVSGQRPSDVL